MTNNGMTKIFSEILDRQTNVPTKAHISSERLYAAFSNGPELNEEERQILLKSPMLRYKCVNVINQINQDIKDQLEKSQIQMALTPLAAAHESDEYHFSARDFDVYLYDKSDPDMPLIVLLQLSPKMTSFFNKKTRVRLYDSGGLDWIIGKPDKNGQIITEWLDNETNLVERSKMYSLHIEPI
jgi:hypothetical protein